MREKRVGIFPEPHPHLNGFKMKPSPGNLLIPARLKDIVRWSFCIFICIGSSRGAAMFWDGGSGTNGNWSTVARWNGDTAAPGVTDGTGYH